MTGYLIHFPRDLTRDQVYGVLLSLSGSSTVRPVPTRLSVRGVSGRISHSLDLSHHPAPGGRLDRLVPGLLLEAHDDADPFVPTHLWRLWQSSSRRPLRTDQPALVSRALLSALVGLRGDEAVELSWLLGPVRRPLSVGSRNVRMLSESWPLAIASAAVRPPGDLDADARSALRTKRAEPSWRLVGQVAVRAKDHARARQLAGRVIGAIRTSEGPGVRIGVRRRRIASYVRVPLRWPLQLNVRELVGLLAWPIDGAGAGFPVAIQTARRLSPVKPHPRSGRTLGLTTGDRPLRLTDLDARRHLLITGPTGTGKSTLICNLVLQDLDHGHGVLLLDPKGDLVTDILARYPDKRLSDLVIIDPTDPAPVGVNPLYQPVNPALVADQLLGIFTNLYRDSFGPRTADVLGASLLTLARWGQGSLSVLPMLLTNPGLRRRIVGATPDPLGTGPFWSWYERLKDPERQQIIAPSLNKLRPFSVRPDLRAMLGQVAPRFDLRALVRGRPVVLVNLAKGLLGPESSALLGTMLLNQAWQVLQSRLSVPAERRRHLSVYVDELADYLRLPGDVGDILVQARSLGVGFTLAHQHLDQLPLNLKAAVLANARSRVLFQLSADDARVFASGHPELHATDLSGLPEFEAYASLVQANQVQPYVSIKTEPPPPPSTDVRKVRADSRTRYGVPRADTDTALTRLLQPTAFREDDADADEPLGSRPRRPR